MMRVLLHLGLAGAILLAPILCCCQTALLRLAAERQTATRAKSPLPPVPAGDQELPVASCCHKQRQTLHPPTPNPDPDKPPRPTAPKACACCGERPVAAKTESKLTVTAPEPTGEMLPLACAPHAAGSPEHLGQFRGLPPPGQTGVDARYAALFERHVMHC